MKRCVLLDKTHRQVSLHARAYTSYSSFPYIYFGLENCCLEMITTIMEALLFALMLVFLKIGYESEMWRGAETRLVVQLGVFDAPLFHWPPSPLYVAPWFGLGTMTLFTALWSNSTTAGVLL